MKNRNEVIDIAKGISIIMVVAGHCIGFIPNGWNHFELSVFFFLSGYCYNEKYNTSLSMMKMLFKKRLKSLYIPFIKYGLIFVILHNIFYDIHFYNIPDLWLNNKMEYFYNISDFFKAILGVLAFYRIEQLLAPMWFLPILFLTNIIFSFIGYTKNVFKMDEYSRGIIICIFFFLCYCIDSNQSKFFRVINISSIAIICFYIGYIYKQNFNRIIIKDFRVWIIAFLVYWFTSITGHLDFAGYRFVNPGFFLVCSLLLIYMVLFISEYISENEFGLYLKNIGRISLDIMALHFISFKLVSIIIIIIDDLPVWYLGYSSLYNNSFWDIIYLISGIIIPCIVIKIKNIFIEKIRGI